ncbi:hypothetical protein B5F79_07695 [Olsenella sp. An285]|nr:hypothetical protein B5F79_07695 [Olsenella sp. An285]
MTGADTSLEASTDTWDSYYTINSSGDVSIENGASVDVTGRAYMSGDLEVSDVGSMLTGSVDSAYCVIECVGAISVAKGGKIDVDGRVFGGTGVSVTGVSTLDVDMRDYNHYAVESDGPVTVTDSTLTAKSPHMAVFCKNQTTGSFTAQDSTIDLSSKTAYALFAYQDIDVSGGSLTLSASDNCGAYTYKDLSVTDGTELDLKGKDGLWAVNMTIDGATGTAVVDNAAIYGSGAVALKNCKDLKLDGGFTLNAGGALTIESSSIEVTGSDAIYSSDDVTITDSQIKVDATERPIAGDSVTISGDTTDINATGGWYIGASDELVISGGKVTVDVTTDPNESVMGAPYGNNAVRISGGTVDATVSKTDDADITYALMTNGVAEFTGGTITLESGTGAIYVSKNGGSVSFGSNSKWYQWATSPTGAVTQATDESYSYADDKSAYLRFEPSGTAYRLTVEDGSGAGSYVAGTSVSVVASAPVSDKHFAGWTVDPEGMGVMENANASSTTFTMPACDVTLTATFENHTLTHYEAVPSTCTDDGTIEYWECEECGLLFSDNAGTNQIAEADLVDPADGHNYVNGVCIVCGARQPGQVTPPSDPTYPPEVEEGEGGTVEVTPERPHEGDKVTIAPDPDDGQVVDEIVVIGDDGELIDVVDNGDGTWSFKQPKGSVTITVTFRCDGGELCPTRGFLDVDQSQWYHAAADWAVTEGVLNGYGDGGELLGPLNTITRAEMAQVLWNRAGRPEATADLSQFSDVDPDAWYADAVAWCLSEGIFRGYGDTFGTERPISREEVATVLWRLSGEPESSLDLSSFSDSASVSDYATDALSWAVESDVVTGKDDGAKLDPQGVCTRAEAAAMLMRMGE